MTHDEKSDLIRELRAEISGLKALLTCAANALEGRPVYDAVENLKLIAELRKAAQ